MRDNSYCISTFLSQLEKLCKESTRGVLFRTTAVLDSPNFLEHFYSDMILPKTLDSCIIFAISSWYIEDQAIACLIRESLREKTTNLDFSILELLLESKAQTELFLIETTLFHTRDFFGNFITRNKLQLLYKNLRFRPISRRITRVQRKRGYQDKGSMKETHRWLPEHDYTLTEKQNEIEQQRESAQDTILFLQGFIT